MSGRPDPRPVRGARKPRASLRTRRKPSSTATQREERRSFKVRVLASDQGCVVHDDPGDCEFPLRAHHVTTQQQLRKAGRDDLLWDPKNGATVCESAHRRHHSGRQRIPLARLPRRCVLFAERYGFQAVLDRYYPPAE